MNAPNEVPIEKPAKAQANELLTMHGPTGFLIRKLQRFGLLGWGLFVATLLMHMLIVLVSTLSPRPVVAVDESGRVLGNIEFLKPASRSSQEILATAQRFLHAYLSLNSDTIFEDYAEAMNLMSPDLQRVTKEGLTRDNYLARVQKAKTRSWLEFAQGGDAPQIVDQRGLDATVRVRGAILVDGPGGHVEKPFDTTLALRAVARTTANTAGLMIIDRKDN